VRVWTLRWKQGNLHVVLCTLPYLNFEIFLLLGTKKINWLGRREKVKRKKRKPCLKTDWKVLLQAIATVVWHLLPAPRLHKDPGFPDSFFSSSSFFFFSFLLPPLFLLPAPSLPRLLSQPKKKKKRERKKIENHLPESSRYHILQEFFNIPVGTLLVSRPFSGHPHESSVQGKSHFLPRIWIEKPKEKKDKKEKIRNKEKGKRKKGKKKRLPEEEGEEQERRIRAREEEEKENEEPEADRNLASW